MPRATACSSLPVRHLVGWNSKPVVSMRTITPCVIWPGDRPHSRIGAEQRSDAPRRPDGRNEVRVAGRLKEPDHGVKLRQRRLGAPPVGARSGLGRCGLGRRDVPTACSERTLDFVRLEPLARQVMECLILILGVAEPLVSPVPAGPGAGTRRVRGADRGRGIRRERRLTGAKGWSGDGRRWLTPETETGLPERSPSMPHGPLHPLTDRKSVV